MKNKSSFTRGLGNVFLFIVCLPAVLIWYLLFKAEKTHERYSGSARWKVELLNQKRTSLKDRML